MRNLLLIFGCLLLASCSKSSIKQHAGPTPPDQGCGHCHYLIYKDWKIAYKPYEQVPVPGSTIAPGPFPSITTGKRKKPSRELQLCLPERTAADATSRQRHRKGSV